ncbi:unnamed protein product [Pleuronectes platessa]|uniref:Uncharacterized protein n=1 Tax=Pleuronectes platessa TaxID=8262 RepID=A0A9N7U0J8_PLEPL|nr:unnamed protein product [Pleuronectes platessa]
MQLWTRGGDECLNGATILWCSRPSGPIHVFLPFVPDSSPNLLNSTRLCQIVHTHPLIVMLWLQKLKVA